MDWGLRFRVLGISGSRAWDGIKGVGGGYVEGSRWRLGLRCRICCLYIYIYTHLFTYLSICMCRVGGRGKLPIDLYTSLHALLVQYLSATQNWRIQESWILARKLFSTRGNCPKMALVQTIGRRSCRKEEHKQR